MLGLGLGHQSLEVTSCLVTQSVSTDWENLIL